MGRGWTKATGPIKFELGRYRLDRGIAILILLEKTLPAGRLVSRIFGMLIAVAGFGRSSRALSGRRLRFRSCRLCPTAVMNADGPAELSLCFPGFHYGHTLVRMQAHGVSAPANSSQFQVWRQVRHVPSSCLRRIVTIVPSKSCGLPSSPIPVACHLPFE